MANANPIDLSHEATDFLRTPFVHQLASDLAHQARQSLRYFSSVTSALIPCRLSLFKRITAGQPIALYLAANGAAVNLYGLNYLSLADARLKIGENLVSLA